MEYTTVSPANQSTGTAVPYAPVVGINFLNDSIQANPSQVEDNSELQLSAAIAAPPSEAPTYVDVPILTTPVVAPVINGKFNQHHKFN